MDSYSEIQHSRRTRAERRPRWGRRLAIIAGVLLPVLLVAGILGGRPLYAAAKVRKARASALRGEAMLRNGALDEGIHHLRVAYRLAPQDPEVLRAVARTSFQTGNPEATGFFRTLLEMPSVTLEDRLLAAEVFLRGGERDSAGKLIAALTREAARDPRVWHLALEHSRQFSALPDSITLARNVVSRFPGDAEGEFQLGRFLAESPRAVDRKEGVRLLWAVGLGSSNQRERAARVLAEQPTLVPKEAERLARILEERPGADLETRLVAAQLRVRAVPDSRLEWAEKVTGWLPPDAGVPEVLGVVRWLEQHRALDQAGSLLPLARCRTNLALMGAHVDYLLATRQEGVLEAMVQSGDTVLDSAMGLAARGAMRARLGDTVGAEAFFRGALAAGGRRDLVLPFVAREAVRAELRPLALEAVGLWMYLPGEAAAAGRMLVQIVGRHPDLTTPREQLRQLLGLLPAEEWVVIELGWVELLTNGILPWATEQFERLHRQWPEDASVQAALALARLRRGNPALALEALHAGALDPDSGDHRRQIATAVVLAANGQREAARRMIRSVPASGLQPELEALVQPLR